MPMASEDVLPQVLDFLSLCEKCHKMVGQLWLVNGDYLCDSCYESNKHVRTVYNFKKVEIEYKEHDLHKSYGKKWTKWCGENNDLHPITPEWFCQACTQQQTSELPSYLIRIDKNEYARICSVCLNIALQKKINNIFDLMAIRKPFHPEY